ncbi:MAG: phosphoribosylformylglycinamidine cyclo-ligase [Deltaproteobacteria bacterium]|nr:phosphoribosylformylglycinamidine cyclo-ligase [Deltaproteobacteria bacterium]
MSKYKEAGVDIDSGDQFVDSIASLARQTRRTEVIADVGGFAGLFALKNYKKPVLVSSTDGVGTKILLANRYKKWSGIGIDCVAMCVNDIGCYGAEPLFFLDYLAAAKLDRNILKEVVAGMAKACKEVGCALLGGETAEMPGVYPAGEFDCAGFTVGVVEKKEIIDGRSIASGDVMIGVASSGFHSNGFSLIRKILEEQKIDVSIETLLKPTTLYTPLILKLKKQVTIKGLAHITGGGLIENPPRILPKGLQMDLHIGSWPVPDYMKLFQKKAGLSEEEFLRVFNAGIGLVVVVDKKEAKKTIGAIQKLKLKAWLIGTVVSLRA